MYVSPAPFQLQLLFSLGKGELWPSAELMRQNWLQKNTTWVAMTIWVDDKDVSSDLWIFF